MALGRMYDLAYYELGELISRSILIFRLNKIYYYTHKELGYCPFGSKRTLFFFKCSDFESEHTGGKLSR